MTHHSIERLSVTGGFLDGVSIELADGLNCFIGARGTGKTTALEFIRYGLDRMPDPRIDRDRRHDIEKLVEQNLGRGSLAIDGHMIDEPIKLRAQRLLERHAAIEAREARSRSLR